MVHRQRITFQHAQLAWKRLFQFGQRRDAAAVSLDRGDAGTGAQQGAG